MGETPSVLLLVSQYKATKFTVFEKVLDNSRHDGMVGYRPGNFPGFYRLLYSCLPGSRICTVDVQSFHRLKDGKDSTYDYVFITLYIVRTVYIISISQSINQSIIQFTVRFSMLVRVGRSDIQHSLQASSRTGHA